MAMPNPAANPMQMLQEVMKMRQQPPVDPRSAALEQMMQQQGAQSQMPVIPPDQYMQQQQGQNPNAVMDDQGSYPGDEADAAEAAQEHPDEGSDEDMLNHIQNGMSPQGDSPQQRGRGTVDDHPDISEYPDTPEEFEEKFGRPPSTPDELEFYNGPDSQVDDQRNNMMPNGRQPNMPPSRRFGNMR